MEILAAVVLGGFFGCYRGGIFNREAFLAKHIKSIKLQKILNRIFQGDYINAAAFAIFCLYTEAYAYTGTWSWFLHGGLPVVVFAAIMMLRGATPAWGEYIGAAGGWRPTPAKPLEAEVDYIDDMVEKFKDRPRLWGVLALSIRCGEWGLFIGAPFLTLWPMVFGMLAGPIVFGLSKTLPHRFVWKTFEFVIGALLWLGVAI